jgi:hypothetical protein
MINDTVGEFGLFSGVFLLTPRRPFYFADFFMFPILSLFPLHSKINFPAEAFVADKHGEMSQRAVVRTAALACILGRAAPNATASSGSGGSHVPHAIGAPGHAVVHAAAADDAAATLYGAGRGGSGSDAESDHKSTHIRKRVRIAEPADGLPFTTDTHPVPIADGHAKMSLPPLAAVLSADVHVRPPSPLSLSMPIAAVPFKLSPPRALPPLQSLVPANASGATAKFQVDVEFFKLPPLISTQSLGETSSPKAGRRSSMVAGEEETALLLVTLGANITDNNNNNNNTNTPTNNANNNNHELQ